MAAHPRKGALIAGLILIGIGVAFIMENWYSPLSLWRFIGRYWPALLIIVGASKLYGYFTWRDNPPVPGSQAKE